MEPLRIDVDFPANSGAVCSCAPLYEMANFDELKFPGFRLSKSLGSGTFGTVMSCHFRGRPAAAKLFDANVDFKLIRMEAELLHGFQHENIVELYALFHGAMSGLVLELMEGGSLSEMVHGHKHIAYQICHVLNWALQIIKAMDYLHKRSFVHRDIKPSNMLLTSDYITLKLCDFGTAVELQNNMTNNCGTSTWMAPEVFRGRRYDHRCDIFSFGICLWEIIARRPPFAELAECNPMAVLWEVAESGLRPPPLAEVSESLQQLMARCWADEPTDRPPIDQVKRTLEVSSEVFPNISLFPLFDGTIGSPALTN